MHGIYSLVLPHAHMQSQPGMVWAPPHLLYVVVSSIDGLVLLINGLRRSLLVLHRWMSFTLDINDAGHRHRGGACISVSANHLLDESGHALEYRDPLSLVCQSLIYKVHTWINPSTCILNFKIIISKNHKLI